VPQPHLDIEAIAAEAWAWACANWADITTPRPWLYGVVMNLIYDAGKAAQQARPARDPHDASGRAPVWTSAVPLPGAEWAAQVWEIGQALQRLPAQRRAAVLLDYQGVPRAEIAATLGAPRSPYAATFTVAAPVSNGCWVNPPQHRSKDAAPAWKEGQHDPPDPSPWPTARCAGRPAGHRPVRRPAPRPKGRPPSALLELPFRGGIREKRHQYKAEDDDK
jgi:hypothetical protein